MLWRVGDVVVIQEHPDGTCCRHLLRRGHIIEVSKDGLRGLSLTSRDAAEMGLAVVGGAGQRSVDGPKEEVSGVVLLAQDLAPLDQHAHGLQRHSAIVEAALLPAHALRGAVDSPSTCLVLIRRVHHACATRVGVAHPTEDAISAIQELPGPDPADIGRRYGVQRRHVRGHAPQHLERCVVAALGWPTCAHQQGRQALHLQDDACSLGPEELVRSHEGGALPWVIDGLHQSPGLVHVALLQGHEHADCKA
mmetsp:Transcript_6018/g.15384  ORF Transcript_6018/g.15384 Transcript_6018/m.15384 type:complete len:250 (+) Transcript_6018:503-1252(+)